MEGLVTRNTQVQYESTITSDNLWPRLQFFKNRNFFTLTFKFDLLLKNFNLRFYLMIVAARRAVLSSDNSYLMPYQRHEYTDRCICVHLIDMKG